MTPDRDERVLQRYLDGELPADDGDFGKRLMADPAMRERLAEAQALRAGFRAAKAPSRDAISAPAGFTAKVVAAARSLPSRQQLEQADVLQTAVRLCRRVLLAAALVAGAGLLWHVGLFDRGLDDTLQAAPDEIQQEMDRLDRIMLGGGSEVPPRGK
jgi:anti-sigma factor RsiW